MSEPLEIRKTFDERILNLHLKGRIDAYWSAQLASYLDDSIREGQYDIRLNMEEVNYISSAGIRILLKYYKQLNEINGSLAITHVSDNVKTVLEMVGLRQLFAGGLTAPEDDTHRRKEFILDGVSYVLAFLGESSSLTCHLKGDPAGMHGAGYSAKDMHTEHFTRNTYGLGLGAIGEDFNDCRERFGEFIGLGDVVAYLPTDGTNSPDYMMRSGHLIPHIHTLYAILFSGSFSHTLTFDTHASKKSVPLSRLIETGMNATGYDQAGMVMLAETTGIVGASLLTSPLHVDGPASLFRFPEVRNSMHIATEHEHQKMLTVTVGVLVKDPAPEILPFLRKLSGQSPYWGHFHSAVFSYHPLKKDEIDLNSSILSFFENDMIQHISHLINDDRETTGVGESGFRRGTIWIGRIGEIING